LTLRINITIKTNLKTIDQKAVPKIQQGARQIIALDLLQAHNQKQTQRGRYLDQLITRQKSSSQRPNPPNKITSHLVVHINYTSPYTKTRRLTKKRTVRERILTIHR